MIGQLEIISQSTEKTIDVATNEAHTQIIFVGAWVDDIYDDYLFMIEYQSLGEEVVTDEIGFVLWCEKGDTVYRRTGYLGDELLSAPSETTIWAIGEDPDDGIPDRLQSGERVPGDCEQGGSLGARHRPRRGGVRRVNPPARVPRDVGVAFFIVRGLVKSLVELSSSIRHPEV